MTNDPADLTCSDLPAAGGLLTVDLSAIAANWAALRDRLAPRTGCGAVLKADAYGLGADRVAPVLARQGCSDFFVAMPDEGVALRQALSVTAASDIRIFVLSGPVGSLSPFITHGLIPVLNSPQQVADWLAHAADKPYALQVDSGMNRLGLAEAEFAAVADKVSPCLLLSHLACADDPLHPMNTRQRTSFQAVADRLPKTPASLSASSGIFLGPEYHFDLARPGIGLYGGNPLPGQANPMQAVASVALRILQVRRIDTPGVVGYGATHAVTPGARLATVAGGYADGLLRSLGGRGQGRLGGYPVPIVGRVSMDLISFDVSSVPEALAQPGQWISVLGEGLDLDQQAGAAGTISYELLTGLSRRYARRYIPAAHPGAC